jgi:hypothetical protein
MASLPSRSSSAAHAARSATPREWPSVNGDLTSMKSAIASSAESSSFSASGRPSPRDERHVVQARPFVPLQAEPLAETHGDQALPHRMFHRLSHAQVRAQRQNRQQLGQPHARGLRHRGIRHGLSLSPSPAPRNTYVAAGPTGVLR